jgi:aspartate carbamoyltransferase catalytic subunit
VILPQVTYGIAVRMAIMALIMGGTPTDNSPAGGRRP